MDKRTKITFGELRDKMGVRGLMICCSDYKCSRLVTMSGDRWPDNRVTDILRTLLGSIWRWTGAFFLFERRHRSPVAGMGTPCRIHHRFWSATSLLLHRSELTSHRES